MDASGGEIVGSLLRTTMLADGWMVGTLPGTNVAPDAGGSWVDVFGGKLVVGMEADGDTGEVVTKVGAVGALGVGSVGDVVGLPTTGTSGGVHTGNGDCVP